MYTQWVATGIAASFMVLAGYPQATAAQSERQTRERALQQEREAQAQQQREAQAQQQREAQEQQRRSEQENVAERVAMEERLNEARAQLERAARDVAALSQQIAQPFADDMMRQWRSFGRRAMLGLSPEDTDLGVRVAGVSPGGPAAEAGIEIGDVIVALDGAALADRRNRSGNGRSPTELLLAQMGNVGPGESVTLKIQRDGAERDVTLRTRENGFTYGFSRSKPSLAPMPPMPPGMFGMNPWSDMQLVTLTPELGSYFGTDKGILVVRGPESEALGLRDGDVILDIGGRVPTTPEHAIRILGSFEVGETLKINVMRRQQRQLLEVAVPAD